MMNRDMGRKLQVLLWAVLHLLLIVRSVESSLEVEALMDIKAALDPSGTVLHTWNPEGDVCNGSYEGVFCNEHGKVGNISLQAKGLSGFLSPSIAKLRCLSGLFLHYNNLSGSIPKEIGNLTELVDLYLNVNSLSGSIPPELSSSSSLQVLHLCCNNLTGPIPEELGSLKKLTVLALQSNQLSGAIPSSLGSLTALNRLDLSFNQLIGAIPKTLASLQQLAVLNVRSNRLSGRVPEDLKKLQEGFQYDNNSRLCGERIFKLPACNRSVGGAHQKPFGIPTGIVSSVHNDTRHRIEEPSAGCQGCPSSHVSKVGLVCAIVALLFALTFAVVSFMFTWQKRHKRKISSLCNSVNTRPSTDKNYNKKEDQSERSPSPLVLIEYSSAWDSFEARGYGLGGLRINFGEIEYATNNFSAKNLLGKNEFTSVYKGALKDGSLVAIKCISKTSCKNNEIEFWQGLKSLTQIRHENTVKLKGFCCSEARAECFLIYDYIPNGTLLQKLNGESGAVLDWPTRVKIVHGVAKGLEYLHHGLAETIVHQNLSVSNVLLDQHLEPKVTDCALQRLLADDIIFSFLKNSAALGYLAPEYATIGRLTFKSDIYAFGKLLIHLLAGLPKGSSDSPHIPSLKTLVESGRVEELMDPTLGGNFALAEATTLAKLALACISEFPGQRPSMSAVVRRIETDLSKEN